MRHLAITKTTDMFEGLTPRQRKALVQQDKERQQVQTNKIILKIK